MAFKAYVALATIEHKNQAGERVFAKPAGPKTGNGVFHAAFDAATEQRLLERGVIRAATKRDLIDDVPASEAVIEGGVFHAAFDAATEQRLLERGVIRAATKRDLIDDVPASEAVIEGEVTETPQDELDGLSVEALKATAQTENVDLGAAKKKADIIAAIRKARADDETSLV